MSHTPRPPSPDPENVVTESAQTVPTTEETETTLVASLAELGAEFALPKSKVPEVVRALGAGSMGQVHLGHDSALEREVAVKQLRQELAASAKHHVAFLREARIVGRLQHPNILPVYQLAIDAQALPFFSMQVARGGTFRQWLNDPAHAPGTRQRLEGGLEILLHTCNALSFAHTRGVLHRDVKPENILVGTHGRVYLADWGLALERELAPTTTGSVGTPAYMAPEQARGESIDERADVFSLGAVLYEIVSGTSPYGEPRMAKLERAASGEVTPLESQQHASLLSSRVLDIVAKAIAPNPERRYATVAEFQEQLVALRRSGLLLPKRVVAKDEVIIKQGDPGDSAFMILRGRCRVVQQTHGEEKQLRTMGANEIFGELALLLSTPRTATVIAEEETMLLVIDREAMLANEIHDGWSAALLKALAQRFETLERTTR